MRCDCFRGALKIMASTEICGLEIRLFASLFGGATSSPNSSCVVTFVATFDG
jgi:hypothetical protein